MGTSAAWPPACPRSPSPAGRTRPARRTCSPTVRRRWRWWSGLGQDPARRSELGPLGPAFAQVHVVSPLGPPKAIADLGAYEARDNPDAGQPGAAVDTNPTALARRGATRVAIDAGGNTLLRVGPGGAIATLAVFDTRLADAPPFLGLPPGTRIPMQSVPTSVAPGPDGSWYVGELTGFPFPVGAARVMSVSPGSAPVVVAEGFTNVMDVAVDRAGGLWVLEIATKGLLSGDDAGALVRVAPDGTRTTVLTAGLHAPGGLAVGRRGEVYVSNYGGSAARGEVLRVTPE